MRTNFVSTWKVTQIFQWFERARQLRSCRLSAIPCTEVNARGALAVDLPKSRASASVRVPGAKDPPAKNAMRARHSCRAPVARADCVRLLCNAGAWSCVARYGSRVRQPDVLAREALSCYCIRSKMLESEAMIQDRHRGGDIRSLCTFRGLTDMRQRKTAKHGDNA